MVADRLSDEVDAIYKITDGKVKARKENDSTILIALPGPAGSPWENGMYSIVVSYGKQYPDVAPTVRFSPAISHPNIFASGKVSLKVLENWTKKFTLLEIVANLYEILKCPEVETDQPSNLEAAYNYLNDKTCYESNAKKIAVDLESKSWPALRSARPSPLRRR